MGTLSKLKQYFRVLHNCFPVGVRFSANQPGMRNPLPYSTRLSHATLTNSFSLLNLTHDLSCTYPPILMLFMLSFAGFLILCFAEQFSSETREKKSLIRQLLLAMCVVFVTTFNEKRHYFQRREGISH